MDGVGERLLWRHDMAEQLQRTLGVPSMQLLDAALVPPPGGGGTPSQAAVLAASTGAEAQVRMCTLCRGIAQVVTPLLAEFMHLPIPSCAFPDRDMMVYSQDLCWRIATAAVHSITMKRWSSLET